MSEKGRFKRGVWVSSIGEIRKGATKYVEAMVKVMEEMDDESNPLAVGMNLIYIGYAVGVIAGKTSDVGIEGFTSLLNGIRISLKGEDREEKIQYAIWDKEGDLHTSEEGYHTEEGGEQ